MVERKNKNWKNKSKTAVRKLHVLWKYLQRQRFGLSKLLEYSVTAMKNLIERVKYVRELRQVDRIMRERAEKQNWNKFMVKDGINNFPEVWDKDQGRDSQQWLHDNPTEEDK